MLYPFSNGSWRRYKSNTSSHILEEQKKKGMKKEGNKNVKGNFALRQALKAQRGR